MEFREYASREVSTLIDRLVSDAEGRAEARLDEKQQEHETAVTAILAQIDAQAREHEVALDAARGRFDTQIREQEAALVAARAEFEAQALEQDVALTEARAQLERQIRDHETALASARTQLEEQTEEHHAALTVALARLEEQTEEHDAALAVALARIEEQAREHDAALTAARERLDGQARELEAHVREREELEDAAEAARAQLATLRRELEEQRAALEQQRRDADQQRTLAAANVSTELELLEARSALEAAQAEAQRLTRQFESALEELRDEHVSTLQQQAVARTVLPLDELLTVFESLASASTPSAILTTVVSGLGREFSRVALFRVRGSRLECVSHVGFEFEGDVAKVVIPTSVDSLMTRAVNSRTTQTFVTGSSDEPCAVPFGGSPACAVALPLLSGDAPVAVVYADDSDQLEFGSVPAELLVKFAELVWQHAILVLQRASAAQKTLAVAPVQSFERLA
jgi:hypothetical protein